MLYTPVHAYAWAQSCSWINFSFECVKSEYNVGPSSRAHNLKCSNTTQSVAEVFAILKLVYGGVGADDVASLKYLHTF